MNNREHHNIVKNVNQILKEMNYIKKNTTIFSMFNFSDILIQKYKMIFDNYI